MEESGLPRSSALRNQSGNGTYSPSEVDDALNLSPLTAPRTRTGRASPFAPFSPEESDDEQRAADHDDHRCRRLLREGPAHRGPADGPAGRRRDPVHELSALFMSRAPAPPAPRTSSGPGRRPR